MVVCFEVADAKATDQIVPGVGDDRMVCYVRKLGGRGHKASYYWTHHDERGRLLLTGPSHQDLWKAHRLFLDAIREQAVTGKRVSED